MSARLQADLALVLVAAIWGGTFVMVKDALREIGPLWFLSLRFAIALIGVSLMLASRWRALSVRGTIAGLVAGGFLYAGYALQTIGLGQTTASRAGFITGLSVVLVPVGAAALFRARPGAWSLLGVVLACGGLGLLSLNPEDLWTISWGDLLVLGCAFGFAGHILLLSRVAGRFDPVVLTFAQIGMATVLSASIAFAMEPVTSAGLFHALPAAAFTALFATVGAFYVQTRAQRFTTATHTALIFSLEPVFAALTAFLLGGERLGWREILGCALILAGMLAAQRDRAVPA